MEEEVLENTGSKKAKEAFRGRGPSPGMEEGTRKQDIHNKEVVRRLLADNFLFVWRVQLAASAM